MVRVSGLRGWSVPVLFACSVGRLLAAPIDCGKASTPNDQTICADPFLLQADARLDTMYGICLHMVAMGTKGDLIDSQRAWVQKRQACGTDRNCMRALYAKRSVVFEEILNRVEAHGPF